MAGVGRSGEAGGFVFFVVIYRCLEIKLLYGF
jgi:hypothetical protein